VIGALIWLRKLQFDAIHQNFLDLEDHYGGKVYRGGFAVRPKYVGLFEKIKLSISISSERKNDRQSRRFYISIYLESPGITNFTVMSVNWLNLEKNDMSKRHFEKIYENKYLVEVSEKRVLSRLNLGQIEETIQKMHPFAYALISQKGLILERISQNLVEDTKYEKLDGLVKLLHNLGQIPLEPNSA
jgi:hypothetical protein